LERNARWIGEFILISGGGSVLNEYLEWFFDRLKDRVPQNVADQELDRMIRVEVNSIFGKFRDRRQHHSALPLEIVAPASERFEAEVENRDELRASLECVPDETRELILRALSITDEDLRTGRDALAAHLGLTRNALDQRLSRAYRRIRDRMHGRRGPQKP
jgi:DNA-directed RNA polymerase specialized sigma24 family protein